MIDYYKGVFNFNLLLRIHGSALYKSSLIGLLAVLVYLLLQISSNSSSAPADNLDHPYSVGVLVSSVSFVIVFRANYSYQRYWNAVSALHSMLSKWGDSAMNTAVYAMQCEKWGDLKPHSYYEYEELNRWGLLSRERRRRNDDGSGGMMMMNGNKGETVVLKSVFDCEKICEDDDGDGPEHDHGPSSTTTTAAANSDALPLNNQRRSSWSLVPEASEGATPEIMSRLSRNSHYFPSSTEPNDCYGNRPNGRTPPLFLQELAHRTSLLSAVALSTLRNDEEEFESPLDIYHPGSPLPQVDPDKLPKSTRQLYQPSISITKHARHWLGFDRSPANRSTYNSTRPLSVIGGVSDAEIVFLQKARGSYAKTTLCWCWLSELITRSHLDGTLGKVHAAILSRLYQNLSDGMKEYNRARQIVYIPFPFPHAQLSVFFTFVLVPVIPVMMGQFTNVPWVGCVLTFMAVTCLVGLHEVARELENPFRNVPNELPICTMQADFNEGLLVMFSGYNPDSYWDGEGWLARGKAKRGLNGNANAVDESDAVQMMHREPATLNVKINLQHNKTNDVNGKTVHLSTRPDTNAMLAEELRTILIHQAQEIEELNRLLDESEKKAEQITHAERI
eukprot:scaffold114619_cov55-Cyclotella_meneghiniana.AAC.1